MPNRARGRQPIAELWRTSRCASSGRPRIGMVHLGGALEEVARSESDVAAGRVLERPYCIVAQPGVVDPTRAPAGKQTVWAYCVSLNAESGAGQVANRRAVANLQMRQFWASSDRHGAPGRSE